MNLTAREIVVLKINNLPRTYRNIDKLAVRQSWAFVERPSAGRNGKTRLYVVDKLPEPYRSLIQAALIEKQVAEHGVNTQGSGCLNGDGILRYAQNDGKSGGIATSATHSRNDGRGLLRIQRHLRCRLAITVKIRVWLLGGRWG